MLAILLFVFAGANTLGTLTVIGNSNISGGVRAFAAAYQAALVLVMVLAAVALMHG